MGNKLIERVDGSKAQLSLEGGARHVCRPVNLLRRSDIHLQFSARASYFERADFAQCLVSSDGSTWTAVKTWTSDDSDQTYHPIDIDLSSFTMSSEFWIAFDAEIPSGNLCIDGLKVIHS